MMVPLLPQFSILESRPETTEETNKTLIEIEKLSEHLFYFLILIHHPIYFVSVSIYHLKVSDL